jgi:G3E family GTPase
VRSDLITTLRDLFLRRVRGETPQFQRVVVETTGLADPAPVLHTLMTDPLVAAHYRMDGVVTTVDAVNGMSTLDRHTEAVKQAAFADRILLTKRDLASSGQAAALAARLRALNSGTPIVHVADGAVEPTAIFDIGLYDPATKSADVQRWLHDEAYPAGHAHTDQLDHVHEDGTDHAHGHGPDHIDVNRHDDRIHAFCVTREMPVLWASCAAWLELMAAMRGDDLLRVKGIVNIVERPGRPVVVHGVQHLFHPPTLLEAWPSEDRRTRLVFIVRDLDREVIEDTLRVFSEVTPDQIAAAEARAAS